MSVVIQVDKLSKCYRLGTIGGGTLRADVARWLAKLQGKSDPNLKIGQEHHARLMGQEFWALQDVNFEVKQGEILGVIGRNGAGKSTLLKILSRVTAPTSGEVRVKGRIASLLEVGTGFHPELTGRENVFLNGAILGMSKAEIKKKFDEIVAFAEIEEFIDTPVKRYSSGMYVRLAFAVAAHLEPEILIVDEVLAVGDQQFQTKCLGKMKEVSKGGRTVLFVSHHIPSVQRLCNKGLFLEQGRVGVAGSVLDAVTSYLADSKTTLGGRRQVSVKSGEAKFTSWCVIDDKGKESQTIISRETVQFRFVIQSAASLEQSTIGFVIRSLAGDLIFSSTSRDNFKKPLPLSVGEVVVNAVVRLPLKMGKYKIDLALAQSNGNIIDHWVPDSYLLVSENETSVLPDEWKGILNESAEFTISAT